MAVERRGATRQAQDDGVEQTAEVLHHNFNRVPAGPCMETIAHLRILLDEAERGELIGVAWVGMYKGRQWDRAATGEAQRNRTWLLGMLHAYCAKLAEDVNR